jgi:formylglycine-generating enzyme required for sulfatase activity/serine/threonine protein kinase
MRAAETAPSGATLGPAAPAAPADDVLPELRDHAEFEVLRKLGGGGMGVVYLARDRLTHRQEVLKVVNPHLAAQPGVAERFLREIRAVVLLAHPNIVTAYGALQVGGLLVLKMEYVTGDDLNTVVKNGGPLPVVNACSYARQVALGLQYAFGKGMVHRDIKPGNLILAREADNHVVKIVDFGLVKAVAVQGGTGDTLTQTAQGMGTPAYMAPEQARDAARADIRADIYSLGCTLYFLLAGRPPFSGSSPYDVVEAHRTKTAPPLNEVRKDVPAELAAVVSKMMAKDPARRYQTPAETAHALKPFVKAVLTPIPAALPPVPPPPAVKQGPTEPAKPLAVPAVRVEQPDTSHPTAKPPSPKRPAPPPTPKPQGGAPVVLPVLAGLLVIVALCGGALYWATSGHSDTSREVTHAVATEGTWATSAAPKPMPTVRRPENDPPRAAPKSTGGRGPIPAGDVVAKVKNVSGIELVSIPAGSFYMGSPNDDKGAWDNEKPQHKVTISNSFYLGKYKVTRGQFQRFVDATSHKTEAEKEGDKWTWKKPGLDDNGFTQTDEHPVVCVSWNDADAFCRWLADTTGANVRLPYEAEWEYSCRAVREAKKPTTKFYFGDDESKLGDYAWYAKNSNTTHPCGLKTPNNFGLYDMHGNAWEWCEDGKREFKDRDETDPTGPTTAGASRVFHGGSWNRDSQRCRAACSPVFAPSYRIGDLGFRVLVSR